MFPLLRVNKMVSALPPNATGSLPHSSPLQCKHHTLLCQTWQRLIRDNARDRKIKRKEMSWVSSLRQKLVVVACPVVGWVVVRSGGRRYGPRILEYPVAKVGPPTKRHVLMREHARRGSTGKSGATRQLRASETTGINIMLRGCYEHAQVHRCERARAAVPVIRDSRKRSKTPRVREAEEEAAEECPPAFASRASCSSREVLSMIERGICIKKRWVWVRRCW